MNIKCNDERCDIKYELVRGMHVFKCNHCGLTRFNPDSKKLQIEWGKVIKFKNDENNQKTVQRIRRY